MCGTGYGSAMALMYTIHILFVSCIRIQKEPNKNRMRGHVHKNAQIWRWPKTYLYEMTKLMRRKVMSKYGAYIDTVCSVRPSDTYPLIFYAYNVYIVCIGSTRCSIRKWFGGSEVVFSHAILTVFIFSPPTPIQWRNNNNSG